MPKLLVSLPDRGDVTHVLVEAVITVGRVPDNVLQIEDVSVSSRHAQLTLSGDGDYILRDIGSTNGTELNGREIAAEEDHKLQDGDKIRFGKIDASYVSENPAEARPLPEAKEVAAVWVVPPYPLDERITPEQPKKAPHPLASVGGIAGAVGGWTLSQYCGAAIWIPGAATILFLVLFNKTPLRPKYFAGAIATTAGHVTWFVVASAILGAWSATGLDIILLTAGIIWLWVQPGLVSAVVLGLMQLGSLAINLYSLSTFPMGSPSYRALTAHCAFRVIALTCLVVGYLRLRRERSNPPPLPGAVVS